MTAIEGSGMEAERNVLQPARRHSHGGWLRRPAAVRVWSTLLAWAQLAKREGWFLPPLTLDRALDRIEAHDRRAGRRDVRR